MNGKLLHLVFCIIVASVLRAVCLDENFDYWYSNDDGLVPGHPYSSQRTQNFSSKRHLSDEEGLTDEIRTRNVNSHHFVRHGSKRGQHCNNMLCSFQCTNGGKLILGICKNNQCLCGSRHSKLRTYVYDYDDYY